MAESPLEESPAKRESLRLVSVQPRWEPWRRRAFRAFAAGFVVIAVMIGFELLASSLHWGGALYKNLGTGGFALLTLSFCCSAIAGVVTLVKMAGAPAQGRGVSAALVAIGPVLIGSLFTLVGYFLTAMSMFGFTRGRQIRKRGKVLLAPLAEGDDWSRLSLTAEAPAGLRAQLAERWRDNGRTEHVAEGGAPVAHALRGSLRAIPDRVASDIPGAARAGAWEAYGLHGEALEAEEHQKARREVSAKVQRLTAAVQ